MLDSKKSTYPCTDIGDGIFDPFVGLKPAKNPDKDPSAPWWPTLVGSDTDMRAYLFSTEASAVELMRPMKESLEGKFFCPSPERVRSLRRDQYESAHSLDSELFHETWSEFIGPAIDNPSLFMFEEHFGYKSRYFVPWQKRINLPIAREMAFGYGIDWDGHMVQIDTNDPMFTWLLSDPLAIYLRERAVVIARALRSKQNIWCPSATRLALEHVGYDVNRPKVDLENDKPANDYDAIILENVSAHVSAPGLSASQLSAAIDDALNKLQVGGMLFFDICLDHWVYRRNRFVFNWNPTPPLYTMRNPAEVAELINQITRNRPVVATFHTDSRNDQPVAVLTSLTKVR